MMLASRFLATAAVFHLGLLAVCWVILGRWRKHAVREDSARLWVSALIDGALFLGASVVLAGLATLLGSFSGFTALRLISQALFAEGVLLTVAVAGVLWRRRRRESVAASALALGLLAVYTEAYHRGPTDLQVRTHAVKLTRSPARGGLRLLHISDIQADRITAYQEHAISRALALAPDLIVLTGDYIQPRLTPTRQQAQADLKTLLRRSGFGAPLGTFAVRGDVDVDWPEVLEGTGAWLLSDSSARVLLPGGVHLTIWGLAPDTSRGQGWGRLEARLRGTPAGDLRVVMGHNPDFVIPLAGTGLADLAIAGHTHGGQVVLPWLGAPYTKSRLPRRYASGLHDYQGVPLHVSAGVGMERGTAPQIRFLCPPEICLLDITY